jgi:hypothetical protein
MLTAALIVLAILGVAEAVHHHQPIARTGGMACPNSIRGS